MAIAPLHPHKSDHRLSTRAFKGDRLVKQIIYLGTDLFRISAGYLNC